MTADPNDSASYDDCGFDISHNNSGLDFAQLAGVGGRKYCIVKVTEGTNFRDPQAATYISGLLVAGIRRLGVYHFAHHGNPIDQMKFFLDGAAGATANVDNLPALLYMLDLERGANPPQETDGLAMVQYLQSEGVNPIIYCGYDFWSQSYPELQRCLHMVAAYNIHPTSALPWRIASTDTYGWDSWQYTDGNIGPWAKTIAGGSHPMDLSCFNLKKHPKGLAAWWDAQLAAAQQQQPTA